MVRRKEEEEEEEDLLGVRYLESVVARFDHFSSSSAAQFPAGIFPENVRGRRGRKGGKEEEGEKTAAAPRPVTVGKKSRRREDPTHTRIHAADTGLNSAEQKKHLFTSRSHIPCAYVRLKHSNILSNIAVVCESETHQL